ncbi:YdeI/OmpD-associated family protein [Candidatus Saccharibacteria bacterium]|nr:YdeI/OmpD-associated family protein [Candidatus Saccharibacteria bacterium]MCB9835073.1 YdeI/OmpD-associated family protein [Candidatus Nomurabacteria bacterium]
MKQSSLSGGVVHQMPEDLAKALDQSAVIDIWQGLTPLARNEFICWVENAKQEQTRARRVRRSIEELEEGKRRPCCWAGCIHRTDKEPSSSQKFVYKL